MDAITNAMMTDYRAAYAAGKMRRGAQESIQYGGGGALRSAAAMGGFTGYLTAFSAARMIKTADGAWSAAGKADCEAPVCTEYESDNYRIKVDTGAPSLCFDIYNQLGERLGAFSYNDIIIKHDTLTGKQFLISEHGTLSYDALVLDEELKNALCKVMGVESLETEKLQGFSLKTHAGTGIQYLLKDGKAGAGGRVLLQSDEDVRKFEALAETYGNRYPNLIRDQNAAYIRADLEIRGLAARTGQGILSINHDGISYTDNGDHGKNWTILYEGDTYKTVFEWMSQKGSMQEMESIAAWKWLFGL